MRVAFLLGGRVVPIDGLDLKFDGTALDVFDLVSIAFDLADLAVIEVHHLACELHDRRHVRGDKRLAIPQPHDERATVARRYKQVRMVLADYANGVRALDVLQRALDRRKQVALVILAHEMGHGLRVGLAAELHALGLQLCTKFLEILDDPVMNYGYLHRSVEMRVRIRLAWDPVRGPAGVADTQRAGQVGARQFRVHNLQLAQALDPLELAIPNYRDARRVIPAVLEPVQAFHDDFHRVLGADIPDYAAHDFPLAPSCPGNGIFRVLRWLSSLEPEVLSKKPHEKFSGKHGQYGHNTS